MENAVDALKIAFAVFVLVLALAVSINSFNMAKATSDIVLYTKDETNYYKYQEASSKAQEKKIVGLETIIPTLYRYYKENYTVVFKQGNYNPNTGEITNESYLNVYESFSNKDLWASSYANVMNQKYNKTPSKDIFSFDLDEEILRHEPWTGSVDKIKSNLDAFLNGSTFISPINKKEYKTYASDYYLKLNLNGFINKAGFIGKYKDAKFIESIGKYTYRTSDEESDLSSLTKDKEKRVIIFTLIKN